MEGMRALLRESLRKSLQTMGDEDRLAAAWPVACGVAMAGRGEVVGYEDGVVRVYGRNRWEQHRALRSCHCNGFHFPGFELLQNIG